MWDTLVQILSIRRHTNPPAHYARHFLPTFCPCLQAHESSLQWRLGLLSSTAFRSGTALLPCKPRILQIVAALADAPSQVGRLGWPGLG